MTSVKKTILHALHAIILLFMAVFLILPVSIAYAAPFFNFPNSTVTCTSTESGGETTTTCRTEYTNPPENPDDITPPPPPQLNNTRISGYDVTGTTEPGAAVLLEAESGAFCNEIADSQGQFSCDFGDSPVDGEGVFGYAVDENGNVSQKVRVGTASLAPDPDRSFLREGVFGCQAGEYAMPVGTLAAIGGVYVPVNDAAVTLNTGYLVYKECVLDGVIVAMREKATADIVKSTLNYINSGRNGKPYYPQTLDSYLLERGNDTAFEFLKEYNIQNICEPFKQDVRISLAKQYLLQTQNQSDAYRCSLGLPPEELEGVLGGDFPGWNTFLKLATEPQNHPLGAFLEAETQLSARLAATEDQYRSYLQWSNGMIPAEEVFSTPTDTGEERLERRVLTPGYVISQTIAQMTGSGFRQLESATEVDQIIGALFSGIGNQIITDIRGLRGLSESRRGKAPYLSQLSTEASARVRQSATNTALVSLSSSITTETTYGDIKKDIAATLKKATEDLHKAEAQCWKNIIPKVQAIARKCTETDEQTTTDQHGNETTREVCVKWAPIPLEIYIQNITKGALTMETSIVHSFQGGATVFTGNTLPSPVKKSSLTIDASAGRVVSANQTLRMGANSAPIINGSSTVPFTAKLPLSAASVYIETDLPDIYITSQSITLPFTVGAPFSSSSAVLGVASLYPFAQNAVDASITPTAEIVAQDLDESENALGLLSRLANDVQGGSQTAQRIALERLDTLISQRAIHTAYDVKAAQEQKSLVASTMSSLVEDTLETWADDASGWCNYNEDTIIEMWLNRWRTDGETGYYIE